MTVLDGLLLEGSAAEVLDPDAMSRRLAPLVGGGVRVLAARLVAIAPGRRAVVAYDTTGPALLGKVFARTGRAGRLHALLVRLEELGIAAPRPIAHIPELRAVVFTASPGRSLDLLRGADRRQGVVAAAAWMSRLHGSGLELDRTFDIVAERHSLLTWSRQVAAVRPAAGIAAVRLLGRLDSLADRLRLSTATPIHKDLHYQHTLVEETGDLVVIDLDEARCGDPAFDAAHFGANLRLLALREGGGDEMECAFLDAWSTLAGRAPGPAYRWSHAYTCLKIAAQLVRGRGPAPSPAGAELDRQLHLILDEGLRCRW